MASFAGASPVPVNPADVESAGLVATICSDPLGLAVVGAKTTSIVQLPSGLRAIGEQLSLAIRNSVEPATLACKVPVGDAPAFITVKVTAVAPLDIWGTDPKS